MIFEFGNQSFDLNSDTLAISAHLTGSWKEKAGSSKFVPRQNETKNNLQNGINYAVVNISQQCNCAKCLYCFASGGAFQEEPKLMDSEVGRKSIDWLIDESDSKNSIYYNFIGGEPLLNISTMREIIEWSEKRCKTVNKTVQFHVSTNGTIFNKDVCELLKDKKLGVNVSCDGTKEIHDYLRSKSYDELQNNFQKLLDIQPNTLIYTTLTALNTDLVEYVNLYRNWNCKYIKFGPVSFDHPGISWESDRTYTHLKNSYTELAFKYFEDLINNNIYYIADFYRYISRIRKKQKLYRRCGAGSYYVNIDANGDIYICHRFTAEKRYHMGTLWEKSRTPLDLLNLPDVNENANCLVCDIRYLCGGPCLHDSYILNGYFTGSKPASIRCRIDELLVSIAAWLIIGLELYNPSVLDQLDEMALNTLY